MSTGSDEPARGREYPPLENSAPQGDPYAPVDYPTDSVNQPPNYGPPTDFQQPDFQDVFFGANYPKLLQIKQKYDPNSLLYARAAVGSEVWTVAENGRMCKTQS